jgi:hypothetical protein
MEKGSAPNYIYAREAYMRALGRYQAAEESLRLLLGAKDCYADLDRRILEARTQGLHTSTILAYQEKARALDDASKALDLAEEMQRRRVAEAAVDADIKRLEC